MEVKLMKALAITLFTFLVLSLVKSIYVVIEGSHNYPLKYEEIVIENEGKTYNKPKFNVAELNEYTDTYIEQNACDTLNYDIFKITDDIINLYLDCGRPESLVYDYINGINIDFKDLVKEDEAFETSVKNLLNLKYPKFVSESIDVWSGMYDIKENELVGYYKSSEYGDISIKINNNEIKDAMVYTMKYDKSYENEVFTLDPNKKTIAFSFDDGPSTYDIGIIDALVDSHSSATFFLVGNRLNNFKTSIQKMIDNNMEVGNHTYSHKQLKKLSKSQVLEEISKTSDLYTEITGKKMTLFRPPYGAMNNSYLAETGFASIIWSVDTLDWQSRNADKVYAKIMDNIKDGDIVLMHSLYPSTLEAVKRSIPALYKQGYQIVSVSKLFELKGKKPEIGSVYVAVR